jgi:hypothetical protein
MPRVTRTRTARRTVPDAIRRLLATGEYDVRDDAHALRCWELHKRIVVDGIEPPEMRDLSDLLPSTAWCYRALRQAQRKRARRS